MSPDEKFGLSLKTRNQLQDVFEKHPGIEKVIIYGSRAKGNFKPNSDIDITIISPQMSLKELSTIENQIDDLMLPYKIDASLFHQIDNAELLDHIHRIGIVFFEKSF